LVKSYLFEGDMQEEPLLPSTNQLKYKILIKNKKIQKQQTSSPFASSQQKIQEPSTPAPIAKHRINWLTKVNSNDRSGIVALGKYISVDDNGDQNSLCAGDDIHNEQFIDDD
jgi:hypothetical protein